MGNKGQSWWLGARGPSKTCSRSIWLWAEHGEGEHLVCEGQGVMQKPVCWRGSKGCPGRFRVLWGKDGSGPSPGEKKNKKKKTGTGLERGVGCEHKDCAEGRRVSWGQGQGLEKSTARSKQQAVLGQVGQSRSGLAGTGAESEKNEGRGAMGNML